ncbi:MAG: hypothetical protein ABIH66_04960 [bacterium]
MNNIKTACFAILLVLFSLPASAERCMTAYYDERYPVAWMSRNAASELRDFSTVIGFEVMGAEETAGWMKEKVEAGEEGCLLLMTQDVVPEQLVEKEPTPGALIRKYLNAGGSVLWLGDVPFYFVGGADGEKVKWDYLGGRGVLGIDTVGSWQVKGEARPTARPAGADWGLKSEWTSRRALPVKDVDLVLAEDPNGSASGWTKSYSEGSLGFIRLWDASLNTISDSLGEDVYKIVSRAVPGVLEGGRFAEIYLFRESDYYPLVHRRGDGLAREILATFFQPGGEEKEVFLDIREGGEVLGTIPLFSGGRVYFRRAMEAPLLSSKQTLAVRAVSGGGGEVVAEKQLNEKDVFCEFKWVTEGMPHPVDLGYLLRPEDMVILTEGQGLAVAAGIHAFGTGKKRLSFSAAGGEILLLDGTLEIEAGVFNDFLIEIPIVDRKIRSVSLNIMDGDEVVCSDTRRVAFREKTGGKRGFGAYWTSLEYPDKVPIYDREKEEWGRASWDKLWERGPKGDVVVNFENGQKFVFWRGSGYVPFWASARNVGMTYEWLEAAWGRGGLVDCIEPLQDKECRYSRAMIVSSTPARAVVRWRYALADLEYTIADGEWAEETYVFYPDGYGVRNATGWFVPMTWHEANEFIVNIPAGVNPFDILPEKPVKIMSLGGKKVEVAYPQPDGKWEKGEPAIFRVRHHRDDPFTPVMALREFDHFIVQYDGWKVDGRYISPSYWGVHYPVVRGYPTTVTAPQGWRERPGHASLMAIETVPLERKLVSKDRERVRWAWLIGNTDAGDEALIAFARNWLEPAGLEVLGGAGSAEYDVTQMAYSVETDGGSVISLKFTGGSGNFISNPAFVLNDTSFGKVTVAVDGVELKAEQYRYGVEQTYETSTGVLWINMNVPDDAELRIEGIMD